MPSFASIARFPGNVFAGLLVAAALLYSVGQTGDLPYASYPDESIFGRDLPRLVQR
jgi:hypothetical protein